MSETNTALQARELIVFCDGFDEGGLYPQFSRRARMVARDLLDTLDMLDSERSARRAMQETCMRWQAVFGKHADDDLLMRAARSAGLDLATARKELR